MSRAVNIMERSQKKGLDWTDTNGQISRDALNLDYIDSRCIWMEFQWSVYCKSKRRDDKINRLFCYSQTATTRSVRYRYTGLTFQNSPFNSLYIYTFAPVNCVLESCLIDAFSLSKKENTVFHDSTTG